MEDNSKTNPEELNKKSKYEEDSIFVNPDKSANIKDDLPSAEELSASEETSSEETVVSKQDDAPNESAVPKEEVTPAEDKAAKENRVSTSKTEIPPTEDDSSPKKDSLAPSEENTEKSSEENAELSEDEEKFPDYSNIEELSDEEILNGKDFDFSNIEKIREQIAQNMPPEFAELLEDDDEEDEEDSVVKKYNVYISKDFVPYIDNLSTNELSAYINDAIQKKIDLEEAEKSGERKQRILGHFIVAIITVIIFTPVLLYTAHKSITATLNNYKYSQDNFEKLYSEKLKKNSVYTRSLKYNKLHEID